MKRLFAILALLIAATPAAAQQRSYSIGSFDRVRVSGPYRVIVTLGASPSGVAEGDMRVTDLLDIRVEGTTLIVKGRNSAWGEQPAAGSSGAAVIRVSTQAIRAVTMTGAGQVSIAGPFRGQRIDLAMIGNGTLDAPALDADQLFASVLGSGSMTLGGRAAKVQLTTSGTAGITASALDAGDLTVRLDGSGAIAARARYTAGITASGLGSVTVYGTPACTVNRTAQGPVSCGKLAAPGE
ncbi:head GIN domain-containing protein [Sphingomonas immobilis]|uniref:Head GIN domain-containing protein n=1 Tax=Sphingomonas immobilis TaxID=3063997 RepID=A0ABT8ZUT5_9SPHN|nr:head GIN domain-containing protein [Sphingomonas sp. CA1-15]MDO7841334.1 head GIN domain-containing protein [Sphingomonas sp. CA1-15]